MSSGVDEDDDVITYNETNFSDKDDEEVVLLQEGPALTLKMLQDAKRWKSILLCLVDNTYKLHHRRLKLTD